MCLIADRWDPAFGGRVRSPTPRTFMVMPTAGTKAALVVFETKASRNLSSSRGWCTTSRLFGWCHCLNILLCVECIPRRQLTLPEIANVIIER